MKEKLERRLNKIDNQIEEMIQEHIKEYRNTLYQYQPGYILPKPPIYLQTMIVERNILQSLLRYGYGD